MAEREGFEPPDPCGSTVFKTAALNHSATSPKFCILPTRTHPWCAARPAPPCAVVRWRGETLSLSAKTPAHPLGHLSGVYLPTSCTRPWCAARPAPPCAGVRWRGETLSLSAKTPAHPLGHLSGVYLPTSCTRPWCAARPAPPCAGVRWRGETLSLSAKTPAHPLAV